MAKPKQQAPLASYRSLSSQPEPPKKKHRLGIYALAGLAILIFSAVWNPPTGSVHDFTEASNYRADREGGCTNSGKGCHGDETSYRSFNDYHPKATCTTCHKYQGVGCIPCHSPKNHECQVCHDGSLPQAPDRVRLADPYPRGHYRESTHTAMATPFDKPVRSSAKGRAKAACKACHARDLASAHLGVPETKGSEYGPEIGCGECHNDTRSSGQAQVLADWKPKRSCEACHRKGSSTPMHAAGVAPAVKGTSKEGCGATGRGCHDGYDLHALHPDRPRNCSASEKGEGSCHDLELESAPAKQRSCSSGDTSCHKRYVNDDYGHKKDETVHSPEGTSASGDTSYFKTGCGDCHWMEPDGTSLVGEHLRSTSSRTGANVCTSCHNNTASAEAIRRDWPRRDSSSGCADCHGRGSLDPVHGDDIAPSHKAAGSAGCASSGAGCHPTSDLSAVGPTGLHLTCLRCHDATPSDGNLAWDPGANSCGEGRACHAARGDYEPRSAIHAGTDRVDGLDPAHRASRAFEANVVSDASSGTSARCGQCHARVLGAEHARPNGSLARGNTCRGCHNANARTARAVKLDWPGSEGAMPCEDCHAASAITARHGALPTSHTGVELAENGTATPGSCATVGCHATSELLQLHKQTGGCTTSGCHRSTGDIFGKSTRSCGGPENGPACHAGYSALGGHDKVSMTHIGLELSLTGTPQLGACSRDGCHTTVDLKRLHGADGCTLSGCHSPGSLLTQKSCGGPDPAGACHAGFTEVEHFVDHDADLTGTANGIEYGPSRNAGCFGCHATDLSVEHSGTALGPITGGGASSCRVCHDDPEDPGNGRYAGLAAVESAVATRDLRCIACHDSGGAAPDASSASSAHKRISSEATLPAGYVWSDPFSEWRAAFESDMGGGHNVLSGSLVGTSITKLFPLTAYSSNGTTYTWELPENSGATLWLDGSAFGAGSLTTLDGIRHATIGCDDCHVMGNAAGPQGSAVPISIDPAYSQTEYANPSRGLSSQFSATSTERVVCMKCHTLLAGSVAGTSTPGGAPVHAQHAVHLGAPSYHPLRYGEKCVDCHVRIPHAWRSPRLLVRTVAGTDRAADEFPYVSRSHDGLAGVRLRDIGPSKNLARQDCATGGCHGYRDATDHPSPSDIPTATYWP